MQTTDKKSPFGIPLYAFVIILVLVLASAGAIAGRYLDLNLSTIFSGNQPKTTTSIQPNNSSVSISAQQVSVQPHILVENRAWARHGFAQPAPFQANVLVENKEWARHDSAQQISVQPNILVENKEWSR